VRRTLIFAITIIFAVALLARATTYTVRFTEKAVLTTFGKAGEGAVQEEPGLKFKWPVPIQSVTKYDTRSRFLQTRSETQQTADERQLIVEGFCTWKVSDPLLFFQRFSNAGVSAKDHYAKAESVIRDNLRSALGETSKYRLDELFTTSSRGSRLPHLEQQVLATLRAGSRDNRFSDYGIEIDDVGINRIRLPEATTQEVINSMKADRERLVKTLESKGASMAQTITSTADSNARRIEQFARAYAEEIRQQGNREAQQYIAQMNESPELAVFLKQMEFMRTALAKQITFVFTTDQPGFEAMNLRTIQTVESGKVPGVKNLMGVSPTTVTGPGVEQGAEQRREPAVRPVNEERSTIIGGAK
jgi:modulator of FtsH protease HflC